MDDRYAFQANPAHRWIYDRMLVARSQGIECGLHDEPPPRYPVFCKPVINLGSMGVGACVLLNEREFRQNCAVGTFWMKLLTGDHVSSDLAVVKGEVAWSRHTLGIASIAGTFDHWVVEARSRPRLERYCADWISANLSGYTGMLNIESIGGRIVEAHLRFADQWPDLYGRKWLDAVVGLYHRQTWDLIDAGRADGYSLVLFGPHGRTYAYPKRGVMEDLESAVGISSIQLTFFEDRPPESHPMPPGGFRLAVINCFNLAVGLRTRELLARELKLLDAAHRRRSSSVNRAASALKT